VKNWRSTLSGAITSAAGLILALSGADVRVPHWLSVIASFVLAGGLASMGIVGKDAATTPTVEEVEAASIKQNKPS
jgi:hypothetical protein